MTVIDRLMKQVVKAGICTGCGACAGCDLTGRARMIDSPQGPVPDPDTFPADLPESAWDACPGKGIHYPALYRSHYHRTPDHWLSGITCSVHTGHASDPAIRAEGASGGIITRVLIHLLEEGLVDAAIVVKQGVPEPLKARAVIVSTVEEIREAAQSVYIPVSVLDILPRLEPGKRYAMTCLPDQSSALRTLQAAGHEKANQIAYVLGPYTGTALYPAAISGYLKSKGVARDDAVTSLKWRAGEWPGYLEIKTASGKVLRSQKIYYNFLIPFYVTQNSLQNMDFANEFSDLAVGDAWSPVHEARGGGYAVVVTRTPDMKGIIEQMQAAGKLTLEEEEALKATDMHGHMMDFKKRGGYIRNRMRRMTGRKAPDFGMKPVPLPASRIMVELVISTIFVLCRNPIARWVLACIPESVIGPLFNRLRLTWKALSKPTKRKGLANLGMEET